MPTEAKRKSMNVTLPDELEATLRREAEARVMNPSLLVELALMSYLPTLPELPKATDLAAPAESGAS